jgi:hypothetical protein
MGLDLGVNLERRCVDGTWSPFDYDGTFGRDYNLYHVLGIEERGNPELKSLEVSRDMPADTSLANCWSDEQSPVSWMMLSDLLSYDWSTYSTITGRAPASSNNLPPFVSELHRAAAAIGAAPEDVRVICVWYP